MSLQVMMQASTGCTYFDPLLRGMAIERQISHLFGAAVCLLSIEYLAPKTEVRKNVKTRHLTLSPAGPPPKQKQKPSCLDVEQ